MMKHKLLFGVLVLAVVLGSVVVLPPVAPAYAATNGQQIYVQSAQVGINASVLKIEGRNQNGTWATLYRNLGVPGYSTYYASNYWWKDVVKVTLGLSTGYQSVQISCNIFVPKSQWGDWVRVKFNRYGCWAG